MKKLKKTNAMRQLDAAGISYSVLEYEPDESDLSGVHVADQIGLPCEQVFKTLVTRGDRTGITVFVIPCNLEIDLKSAAIATANKSITMMHTNELLANTGYIRGGCSPIGMKKNYPTFIDEHILLFEKVTVSSGTKGMQLLLSVSDLLSFTGAKLCKITV